MELSREETLVIVLLAVVVFALGFFMLTDDPTTTVDVDNRDDREYVVAVYSVPDVEDPDAIEFAAQTESGFIEPVSDPNRTDLVDVTIQEPANLRGVLDIPPNDHVSADIGTFGTDSATVYVVETNDGQEEKVAISVFVCDRKDRGFGGTIVDGDLVNRFSNCG